MMTPLSSIRHCCLWAWLMLSGLALCSQTFPVSAYEPHRDGETLDTEAIQAAIDACAAVGGGRVVIQPGRYLIGSLVLKSGVELHLSAGATLLGSTDLAHYTAGEGQKGSYFSRSLIYANGAEGISLTGQGTIDGQGRAFWDENFRALERPRPWLNFVDCTHLRIEGLRLLHSPAHVLALDGCRFVRLTDLHIENDMRGPNTDGIDLYRCAEVFIQGCYISTGDDAICFKSRPDRVMENIVVRDCVLESDDAAIKFGTGSGGINRYISCSNLIIRNTRYAIALFMIDGGRHEHLSFDHIQIQTGSRHKTEYPIFIDIDQRKADSELGQINHLSFSNLDIHTQGNILIAGQAQAPIRDLHLRNVRMYVAEGMDLSTRSGKPRGNKNLGSQGNVDLSQYPAHLTLAYIDGLDIDGLYLLADSSSQAVDRHGLYLQGVQQATVRRYRGRSYQAGGNHAALALRDTRDVLLTQAQAPAQTGTFLQVLDSLSGGLRLLHNDFSAAEQPWQVIDGSQVQSLGNLLPR